MNRIETEYQRKLKIKQKQLAAFRRFLKGETTAFHNIRGWVGLNYQELKVLIESRMQPSMNWTNYGKHWVVDHIAPFWIFDIENEADLKLLWHPDNLLPLISKDNLHKQGDLRFAMLLFTRKKGYSFTVERLMERLEKEIKVQDKYLYGVRSNI